MTISNLNTNKYFAEPILWQNSVTKYDTSYTNYEIMNLSFTYFFLKFI